MEGRELTVRERCQMGPVAQSDNHDRGVSQVGSLAAALAKGIRLWSSSSWPAQENLLDRSPWQIYRHRLPKVGP